MEKFDKNGVAINYGNYVKTRSGTGFVVETPEAYSEIDGIDKVWISFKTSTNKGGTYWASPSVVEVLQKNHPPAPHAHAELIKKWADDTEKSCIHCFGRFHSS